MGRLHSLRLLLAVPALCAGLPVQGAEVAALPGEAAASPLRALLFQGGSSDDEAFARVAAVLPEGALVTQVSLDTALAAIRATDRFRSVTGQSVPGDGGLTVRIQLDPWPRLERLLVAGVPKGQLMGLRVGDPVGDRRLESWRRQQQTKLVESGYPAAQIVCERTDAGKALKVAVSLGPPALVTQVELVGALGPYDRDRLLKVARIQPGKTLWTQVTRLESLGRLRKQFIKDARYESQVEEAWLPGGLLRFSVNAGPVVRLAATGDSLGMRVSLKDLVPLARANRYSPEILDEGERRMVRLLRGKGYLDAQVAHRREVIRTGPAGPEAVLVTYTVHRGQRCQVRNVRFERNHDLTEAELRKAAALPASIFTPGGPKATPELVDGVEARVKALYLSRGYTEATVRLQPLVRKDGAADLVFRVYEGPRHLVRWLRLELPAGDFGAAWSLGESLALIFADQPVAVVDALGVRHYRGDQSGLGEVQGVLAARPGVPGSGTVLTLTLDRPIPLLKSALAKVFDGVRQQRLPALGVLRPVVRLSLEPTEGGTGVVLEVPPQAMEKVQRLVVQGAGRTRARAVLRESQLTPGSPLDLATLSRSQARLSFLGAFQRVDLASLAEPGVDTAIESGREPAKDGPPVPWKQGDLALRLEERPRWLLSSSFGYDQSQGYHVGLGAQRLNLGGMGRTLDFGIRAGDGTINAPALRRLFPTGTYDRSVDSYTVGYTDPWFAPGAWERWLPERTQLTAEAAYVQEQRSLYLLRRRRLTTALQWLVNPQVSVQVGYRYEQVDVAAALDSINSEQLRVLARYPDQATISAPFLQVARDTRDNPYDPTRGSYSVARLELASQFLFTSQNASFAKLDLRQQWTWPLGEKARAGVLALGLRVGVARPTAASSENLPLSERFFAGGPFSQRGVEPDGLGPLTQIPLRETSHPYGPKLDPETGAALTQTTPLGGQALALVNLEYRFPLLGKSVWGEVFLDSGQVYESLKRQATPAGGSQFPPLRTSLGFGLIFKVSIPIKLEYAVDVKRIMGRPRSAGEVETQLKGLLVSAGFQF